MTALRSKEGNVSFSSLAIHVGHAALGDADVICSLRTLRTTAQSGGLPSNTAW